MKFNDSITLDIAKAVSDVLEGKVKKEEMDPTDHVKKSDEGKFCVYNAANKKVAEFDTKDKADKYAVDNHDKLMAAKNEVAEPRAKGEKDFKDKHVKKVSGMKNDGTNIKEAMLKVRAWTGSLKKPPQGLEIAKSQSSSMGGNDVVFKGDEKDLIAYAKRSLDAEGETLADIQRTVEAAEKTPTGPAKEESEKQKKYQAFFQKALKKFGIKSPAELEGDKKKEFFDYVDKNYEADNESVKEETQLDEILGVRIPDAGKDSSGIRKAVGKDDGGSSSGGGKERMKDDDEITKIQKQLDQLEKMADEYAEKSSDLRDKSEKAYDNGNDSQGDNFDMQSTKMDERYQKVQDQIEDLEDKLRAAKEKFKKAKGKD